MFKTPQQKNRDFWTSQTLKIMVDETNPGCKNWPLLTLRKNSMDSMESFHPLCQGRSTPIISI